MTTATDRTVDQRRHYDDFVTHVHGLCHDNSTRADLRTGRGKPVTQCPRLQRHLNRNLTGPYARHAYFTVATLIALQRPDPPNPHCADTRPPQDIDTNALRERYTSAWWQRPDLGHTLALAVRCGAFLEHAADQTLHVLIRLPAEDLHQRLYLLVSRLLGTGADIDFARLLADLAPWERDRSEIATRWLESFYAELTKRPNPTSGRST